MWWGNVPARKAHSPRVGGGAGGMSVGAASCWGCRLCTRGRAGGAKGDGIRCGRLGSVATAAGPGGTSGGRRSCRCLTGAILAVPRGDFGPAGASRGRTVALWPKPSPRSSWLAPSHKNAPTTFMSSVPSRCGFARACSAPHTVCNATCHSVRCSFCGPESCVQVRPSPHRPVPPCRRTAPGGRKWTH